MTIAIEHGFFSTASQILHRMLKGDKHETDQRFLPFADVFFNSCGFFTEKLFYGIHSFF